MYRCAFTVISFLAFIGLAAHSAGAQQQFAKVDAKCRKSIGLAVRKLSATLLKEEAQCQKLRMQAKIDQGTDCNDPTKVPGAAKVQKAEDNLTTGTAKKCINASSPPQNGYMVCPPPCAMAITDYFSVGDCLKCISDV